MGEGYNRDQNGVNKGRLQQCEDSIAAHPWDAQHTATIQQRCCDFCLSFKVVVFSLIIIAAS